MEKKHALRVLRRGVECVFWLSKGTGVPGWFGITSLVFVDLQSAEVDCRWVVYAMLRSSGLDRSSLGVVA
jgi:hypothetical protein